MKRMGLKKRENLPQGQGLQQEIGEVVRLLELCRRRFDLALDEELLEAAIYEENALLARYRYLLRIAREQAAQSCGLAEKTEERTACLTPSISGDF